jgi:ABC-type nitrate/sulfonate/bicarbonate transport system substrate-binding protein
VRGDVDAIAIWFPHGVGLPLPEDALTELRSSAHTDLSMLVTRAAILDEKREALRRVVRALLRAERLARDRPAAALTALERGLDAWTGELVRDGWALVNPQLGLSNLLLGLLERQAEWRHAHRGARMPDLRALVEPGLLLELDRESVTLLGSE